MIQNNQVTLKKITEEDRDFYTQIYTDKALMKYIAKPLDKAASTHSFDLILKRIASGEYILSPCVILQKTTNKKIGIISLRKISDETNTCEIGIIILETYQRQKIGRICRKLSSKNCQY